MLWLTISNYFIYFFTSVTALRCVIENGIVREPGIENCSSSVINCFSFRCDITGKERKERGCNDNLSNLWNCQALGKACMEAGGIAHCDICVTDLCNNAIANAFSLSFLTTTVILLLLLIIFRSSIEMFLAGK
ncbi:hypothetical protein ACH3XW_35565 [Acanthocheilonema viteae]